MVAGGADPLSAAVLELPYSQSILDSVPAIRGADDRVGIAIAVPAPHSAPSGADGNRVVVPRRGRALDLRQPVESQGRVQSAAVRHVVSLDERTTRGHHRFGEQSLHVRIADAQSVDGG